METAAIFAERTKHMHRTGTRPMEIDCDKDSLAGAVSQRACLFCGSRVVLYPIADALHLVHGPVGCAVYTWDIRGALSSGPELHRLSFSTDLQELDVIFGGEQKLEKDLYELIERHSPKAAFVNSTCIVGLIGDDLEAACKRVAAITSIPVLPVYSEGFKGNKRAGYEAACKAMDRLVGTGDTVGIAKQSINILGDFNLAGEIWMIRENFNRIGIEVVANITGDGRVKDIHISHFNEPIDIASSSLGEKQAIYGGGPNLKLGLNNVTEKYKPGLIGLATTCLTETIGDNVPMLIREYFDEFGTEDGPEIVSVSTPSYSGTHMEGFHAAVRVSGIGDIPAEIFRKSEVRPVEATGFIEEGLALVYANRKDSLLKGRRKKCGEACSGTGSGCD